MDSNTFSYKEIFGILTVILLIIIITENSFHSYAVALNYGQLNSGHPYDSMKRHIDDNAFSNLSRNTTFYAGGVGNVTSPANSTGPNFATGDINTANNFGPNGMGDNGISSGPIFTPHGSYSSGPHMWMHRFH
jgi:hypothetical protein